MVPASTEERGHAAARWREWTRIELVCCEPAQPTRGTGPHDGKHIDAFFRTFETAHAWRTEAHPRFRSARPAALAFLRAPPHVAPRHPQPRVAALSRAALYRHRRPATRRR